MRGSDANAALYWLARMLIGGEDPLFIARRLIAFASEDVGEYLHSAWAIIGDQVPHWLLTTSLYTLHHTYIPIHKHLFVKKQKKSKNLTKVRIVLLSNVASFLLFITGAIQRKVPKHLVSVSYPLLKKIF